MKNLPQIHTWTDRIDADVVSVHAVRGWGDRPSNGVFMLMVLPRGKYLGWNEREGVRTELEQRLREREKILFSYYGPRLWRDHLCDRIRDGVPIET